MFCSQCGKKVAESMLFCPFCGSPIVIPDQEAVAPDGGKDSVSEPVKQAELSKAVSEPLKNNVEGSKARRAIDSEPLNISINWETENVVPESPKSSHRRLDDAFAEDDEDDEEEAFVPLNLEALEAERIEPFGKEDVSGEISQLLSGQLKEEAARSGEHAPGRNRNPARTGAHPQGKKNTYVPVKAFNPNDIFLDGEDEEEYDDYEEEDYDYEEPEYGGFFVRHIRGIVALSLCVVVLAIVAGWAFSDAGQTALANANLAWRPAVYEKLGYQAYQNGSYALSAGYYEKALSRASDNYNYAYSAGIAYYMGGDIARAAEMGKQAIDINPSRVDAYQLLLRLYPDAKTRPWDVSTLLQKGYQLTGDASLNVES